MKKATTFIKDSKSAEFWHCFARFKINSHANSDGAVGFTRAGKRAYEVGNLLYMMLEHYPKWQVKSLVNIGNKQANVWPIELLNNYSLDGNLKPTIQIGCLVWSQKNMNLAFAEEYIMDFLKLSAPAHFGRKKWLREVNFGVRKQSHQIRQKRNDWLPSTLNYLLVRQSC